MQQAASSASSELGLEELLEGLQLDERDLTKQEVKVGRGGKGAGGGWREGPDQARGVHLVSSSVPHFLASGGG